MHGKGPHWGWLISLSQCHCPSEEEVGEGKGWTKGTLIGCAVIQVRMMVADVTSWVPRCWRGRWNNMDRAYLLCAWNH